MTRVAIVVDSTCDLTLDEISALGLTMVPLKVLFGDETLLDWVEITPDQFYPRLASSAVLSKTSQPSPAEFEAAYRSLAEQGFEGIVSIHLSAALSGTCESAHMAAANSPIPVHVVDTREASCATALVVLEACRARDEGKSAEEVFERAAHVAAHTHVFFVLDTLDYLVKGGRAGKAAGLAAALLNIKPVLMLNSDGIIEPFKKVKGRRKAYQELVAHVAEESQKLGRLKVALLYSTDDGHLEELRSDLAASGADVDVILVGQIGAVVGTYTGPGTVGVAFHPEV